MRRPLGNPAASALLYGVYFVGFGFATAAAAVSGFLGGKGETNSAPQSNLEQWQAGVEEVIEDASSRPFDLDSAFAAGFATLGGYSAVAFAVGARRGFVSRDKNGSTTLRVPVRCTTNVDSARFVFRVFPDGTSRGWSHELTATTGAIEASHIVRTVEAIVQSAPLPRSSGNRTVTIIGCDYTVDGVNRQADLSLLGRPNLNGSGAIL